MPHTELVNKPSSKEEAWKYSAVEKYFRLNHPVASRAKKAQLKVLPEEVEKIVKNYSERIVFYNGELIEGLSTPSALKKITSKNLGVSDGHAGEYSAEYFEDENFSNQSRGLSVELAAKSKLEVLALFLYGNQLEGETKPCRYYPRHHFILQTQSQLKVFEFHFALNDIEFSINQSTTFEIGEGARLDRVKAFWLGGLSYLFDNEVARLMKESCFENTVLNFGGQWTRYQSSSLLNAKKARLKLSGLCLLNDKSHYDITSFIHHKVGDNSSDQLFKSILCDGSRSAFNGRVLIDRDAQKTEVTQLNQNLVLGDKAEADTRPQLEVYADDVKATHGATVGQLSDAEIFYLQSRGISLAESTQLVAQGFATHVVDQITDEKLKSSARHLIKDGFLSIARSGVQ